MTACWLNKALFKDATWAFKLRLTLMERCAHRLWLYWLESPLTGAERGRGGGLPSRTKELTRSAGGRSDEALD